MSEEDFSRLMEGYTVESSIKSYPRIETGKTGDKSKEISHKDSEFISNLIKIVNEIGDRGLLGESSEYMAKNGEKTVDLFSFCDF